MRSIYEVDKPYSGLKSNQQKQLFNTQPMSGNSENKEENSDKIKHSDQATQQYQLEKQQSPNAEQQSNPKQQSPNAKQQSSNTKQQQPLSTHKSTAPDEKQQSKPSEINEAVKKLTYYPLEASGSSKDDKGDDDDDDTDYAAKKWTPNIATSHNVEKGQRESVYQAFTLFYSNKPKLTEKSVKKSSARKEKRPKLSSLPRIDSPALPTQKPFAEKIKTGMEQQPSSGSAVIPDKRFEMNQMTVSNFPAVFLGNQSSIEQNVNVTTTSADYSEEFPKFKAEDLKKDAMGQNLLDTNVLPGSQNLLDSQKSPDQKKLKDREAKKSKRKERVKKQLNSFIRRLESKWTPQRCQRLFTEDELIDICYRVHASFMRDPPFIDVPAPVNVCGDIHGQFVDLRNIFREIGYPPAQKYVFLGDYVDRGPYSLEVLILLFCLRLLYPKNVTLLRGNHEASDVNVTYGFLREVKERYSMALFDVIQGVFRVMPFAALVEGRVLCVHGGISERIENINQLRQIHRPCRIPEIGITCDLTWSDPSADVVGYQKNPRGAASVFGPDAALTFCERVGIDYVVRAHQVPAEGYEVLIGNRVLTIFSAMRYCNLMDNNAAVLHIRRIYQQSLQFSLTVFTPVTSKCSLAKLPSDVAAITGINPRKITKEKTRAS